MLLVLFQALPFAWPGVLFLAVLPAGQLVQGRPQVPGIPEVAVEVYGPQQILLDDFRVAVRQQLPNQCRSLRLLGRNGVFIEEPGQVLVRI